jgi:gliding motility-associated-like protein
MTISLTINNVTTTQTQSPQSGVYNTTLANLPGCTTPIIVAAACAGQANTYNNWVVFDYTGITCGVPCSFTITSGNTVFTQDGCSMYPLTVNFTVPCGSSTLNDLYVCDGVPTAPLVVPFNTTWTNSNPGIGLPASGTGNIPSFVPVGPVNSAVISYVNACVTSTFNIYVTPAPIVAFTADTVCAGTATTFTNTTSAGANATWLWDFGDQTTDPSQHPPPHMYAGPGTYNVSLSVTDSGGCTATLIVPVVVDTTPLPSFTALNSCIGMPTQMNNTTVNGTSYVWDFGTATSTLVNPTFTFPSVGMHPVELVVTTPGGCVDSITQNVFIEPPPLASYTYTQSCGFLLANFTNTSIAAAPATITGTSWDFGDPASAGNNTSTLPNPSHTFSGLGTYIVTLIATSSGGCVDTTTQVVTVYPQAAASFTAVDVCPNSPMQFTNTSTNSLVYEWDFGDTNPNDTSSLANPTYTYTASGSYQVLLIGNPGSCADSTIVTVNVFPGPQIAFTAPPACLNTNTSFTDLTTVGAGTITSWSWNFGDGSTTADTSNIQNPTYMYPTSGTFNVILTCSSSNGCTWTDTLPVVVNPLPVANFNSTVACQGAITSLNDLSIANGGVITNWVWDFGDGSPVSNAQNPTHVYPNDSTFNTSLIVTNTNGCIDTINLPVSIDALPVVIFTGDTLAGCPTHCVNFIDQTTIASGTLSTWAWDFGDGSPISNAQNPSHCYDSTASYTVGLTVSSGAGCTTTLVIPNMITVHPVPHASFSALPMVTSILYPEILFTDLSTGSPVQWYWDFGDPSTDGDTSNLQNTSYEYSSEYGSFYDVTLTITNQFGCTDDTSLRVQVEPDFSFFIPNAFTPNGDGTNDGFFGTGYGITKYEIWIFDRWGNLIFTTNDINEAWDGSVQGRGGDLVQIDTYVWKVKLTDVFAKRHTYIGHVSVIR